MNGWKYEWVDELPRDVYSVLVEEVNKQIEKPDDE
jgi:hypothetical protein